MRPKEERRLDELVNLRIIRIQDYATLSIVEEAATVEYSDLAETVSVKIRALRRRPPNMSVNKWEREGESNAAVEKWIKKQEELAKLESGKRRFVSGDTWKRFGRDARSSLDDIAHILYGRNTYSLQDEELEALKALYWNAVNSIFDPEERQLLSWHEQRSKPHFLRRRWM